MDDGFPSFDAIIVAGGAGRRMGADKPSAEVGGFTLLERAISACALARTVVVVGKPRPATRVLTWTMEDPPGGGPLAAIAAGLAALPADRHHVVVLASDQPYLRAPHVTGLVTALPRHDAAIFTDDGIAQPLAGAYDAVALSRRLDDLAPLEGRPVRRILNGLRVVTFADHGATRDCDTTAQLAAARAELG